MDKKHKKILIGFIIAGSVAFILMVVIFFVFLGRFFDYALKNASKDLTESSCSHPEKVDFTRRQPISDGSESYRVTMNVCGKVDIQKKVTSTDQTSSSKRSITISPFKAQMLYDEAEELVDTDSTTRSVDGDCVRRDLVVRNKHRITESVHDTCESNKDLSGFESNLNAAILDTE